VDSAIRSALLWNFVTLAFAQIVLAAIFLLLAARLDPATFGLFALAAVVTDVFYILGISSSVDALVQRQDFSRRTLSSVTWVAAGICVIATIVFFGIAMTYASAMRAPGIAGILEALTLTTLMLPFAIGPTAVMRQQLDLKGLALLNMIASLAGGLSALATSFTPALEWSLVVQRVVATLTFIVLATIRTRLIPVFVVDREPIKLWMSGVSRIFAGQSISSITPRIADLCMGAFFGATAVGYLRVASRLSDVLLGLLVNPISQLWVTLLSRSGSSEEEKRSVFLRLSSLTALIALPGFVGLGLTSREIVGLILPADYAPVAGPLTVLCILGVFAPLTNPRNAVFTALKRFNYLVWFSLLDFTATLVGMLATAQFGPLVMLSSGAFTAIAMVLLAMPLILKDLKLKTADLTAHLTPPYVSVGVMAVAVIAADRLLAGAPFLETLLVKVAVGAIVYLGVMMTFFRKSVMQAIRVVAAR
jgi:O-antigen/teichoic acid export membrane protein